MEEIIYALLSITAVFSFMLFFFFVYLIVKGKKSATYQENKAQYIEENQEKWYSYLTGKNENAKQVIMNKPYEVEAVEEILYSYIRNVSDQKIKRNVREFAATHLQSVYRQQLRSTKWSTRMNALYRIGDFQIKELFEECKKLLNKQVSKEEYFEIMILSSHFDLAFFIKELVSAKVIFSEYEYKKIFFGISPSAELELSKQFELLPGRCQLAYIDTAGLKRHTSSLPFLEALTKHKDAEVRIRSLKAIHEIGVLKDVKKLEPFIDSSIWEERLMSARLLGRLPLDMTIAYLTRLIEDQNWWVRNQAAETIRQAKGGKEQLKQIAETSKDAFAIDVANELLGEGS